jgi:hypothetical protein
MFGRTFSFWRRWVGKSDSARTTAAAVAEGPDERRLWVRYPADLKTLVQRAADLPQARAAAKIRDISRGGANLLLDHEIQPGQLVNLELPSPHDEGTYTILACVVRSCQEPSGRWALGCVFSRELTEEDLLVFGARRVRHAPEDKRTWMRFDCSSLQANFQKIGDPASPWCPARVLNLSSSGIGLAVDEFIDAGALLNIDLMGKDGTTARTILACVVHVAQRSDREWDLGCNFIRELSEEDFQALI